MRFKTIAPVFICCLFVLANCNSQHHDSENVHVSSVTINTHSLELDLNNPDHQYQFQAYIEPNNATNKQVTWTVESSSIGTITSNGLFTATNAGTTDVTVTTVDGGFFDTCSVTVTQNETGAKHVYIGAINDFHGSIIEGDGGYERMGLAKVGTILKELGSRSNTLTLSQGDDWQGSIYSNYNHGKLINDTYSLAKLSARTVGNHDFDWGVDVLKENTSRSYNGYLTPVLAANVYDFHNNVPGTIHQSSIGAKSTTYTLQNGLKVGIVGVIGKDQLTSINSLFTKDIYFRNHIAEIKEIATDLRNNQNCDIVIASCHADQDDVKGNGLENYVDLVLCGHSHEDETSVENGLTYAQFACNGEMVGYIALTYDGTSVTNTTVSTITNSNFSSIAPGGINHQIQSLIDTYNSECDAEANITVANNVSGTFVASGEAANLMCKAMLDATLAAGHDDVLLAYCNTARGDLYSGSWTYADLYRAFPFDNVVFIKSVKGADILDECKKYNNVCYNPSYGTSTIYINRNSYYKIAVLDYLLYHIKLNNDDTRYYDYFKSFDGNTDLQLTLNYRVILRNWLIGKGYNTGTHLDSDDYSSYNNEFKRSRLTQEY